jgi:hypothetical protein
MPPCGRNFVDPRVAVNILTTRIAPKTLAIGIFISVAVAAAAIIRTRPPAPRGDDAPLSEFSSDRARATLAQIAGDGVPHPEGSREAESVRDRLVAQFHRLGDVPEIQSGFACGSHGVCGEVHNVVVRRAGAENRKALLLSAHYDSVAAGPGASDDGMGVAALVEVARALKATPTRRPLVILIDDGEEQGLLGAEAFAARTPSNEILADINVEARGTTGPSLLFETSANNAWLARLFRQLPHPNTSSLFYAVYKTMPNDTDLSVFRAHGFNGVNFACVGGVARYHTPRDDLSHADRATLQHHGENVLAIVRALDRSDAETPPSGDAVYFDLFGAAVVWWAAPMTLLAAVISAALLFTGVSLRFRRRAMSPAGLALGVAVVPAMVLAATGSALLVAFLFERAGAIPAGWIAHPAFAATTFWTAAILSSATSAVLLGRLAGPGAVRCGVIIFWTIAALLLAWRAPSASFPFLIPAVLAAAALVLPIPGNAADIAPQVATAFFFLPMAWMLLDVLGFRGMSVIAAVVALAMTPFAGALTEIPEIARRKLATAAGLVLLIAAVAGCLQRPFSYDVPQRATLVADDDLDQGRTRWIIETDARSLPAPLGAAARFRHEREFPWSPREEFAAPAPTLSLSAPEFRVLDDAMSEGDRRIRGRLISPRGAPIIRMAFPPATSLRSIAIGGVALLPLSDLAIRRAGGWKSYTCVTLPAEGIEVEIRAASGPLSFVLADRSGTLPPAAAPFLAARPPTAVPSQSGDGTVVRRTIRL